MFTLNSREIATLIWLGAFLLFALRKRDVRRSAGAVVRALFQRKLLLLFGLAAGYCAACVWVLWRIGAWEWTNLKTTILWALAFAFVAMMDMRKLEQGPKTLWALAKEALGVAAIVLFIGEFYTLPLWGELLLVPFLTVVGLMLVIAEGKPEHAIVMKPLGCIQVAGGLGILAYSVYRIVEDFRNFATLTTAREFGSPILLSLMFLPFLYGLILYMAYERALIRLSFSMHDEGLRRYAILCGAVAFRANFDLFNRYVRNLQQDDVAEKAGIREAIRELGVLRRRERNPPSMGWSAGWSPYQAREFLAEEGLRTADYHRSFEDWWAESPMIDIGGGAIHDRLIYRIVGTETAATRLTLELNGYRVGAPEPSAAKFLAVARILLERALDETAAMRFVDATERRRTITFEARGCNVKLSRDNWGSGTGAAYVWRLSIRHSANHEIMPGLD